MPHITPHRCRLAAAAVSTAATAALMLGTPAGAAVPTAPKPDATDTGSAFGMAARGPVAIDPVPSVISSTGRTASERLARKSADDLATVSRLSVEATSGHAVATLAHVGLLRSALTAAGITSRCTNGTGTVRIVDGVLAGRSLVPTPRPNTTIPVTLNGFGTVSVTLNKQVQQPDGRLSVTAVSVAVPVDGGVQTVDVGSTTCGCDTGSEATSGGTDTGTEATPEEPAVDPADAAENAAEAAQGPGTADSVTSGALNEAPAPAPVRGDLPVTG